MKHAAIVLLVLLPVAALAEGPARPPAKSLAPVPSKLPGPGTWCYPWEIGGRSRIYKSEREWRQANDFRLDQLNLMLAQLASIPAEDWTEFRDRMRQMGPEMLGAASAGVSPVQKVVIQAVIEKGTKAAVIAAVRDAFKDVVDVSSMEYVKIENPAALEPDPNAEKPPDPGGAAKLKLSVQIRSDESIRSRADEVDVSGPELEEMVASARTGFETILKKTVREASKSLEEDLFDAMTAASPDQEKIDRLTEKLRAMADAKVAVHGTRPMAGNAAFAIFLRSDAMPDQPAVVQGQAQVRRGVAVFHLTFEAAGTYVEKFEEQVSEILDVLAKSAKEFDLE